MFLSYEDSILYSISHTDSVDRIASINKQVRCIMFVNTI